MRPLAERDLVEFPAALAGSEISGMHALDHIPGFEGRVLIHTQQGREVFEVDVEAETAVLRASAYAAVGSLSPVPLLDADWPDQELPFEHSALGLVTITGNHMGSLEVVGSTMDPNLSCGVVLYDLAPYDGAFDGWFELTPANALAYQLRE